MLRSFFFWFFSGPVLFIEEDHFMVEDFIHVLKRMRRICPECKIFSLGTHSDDGRILSAHIPQVHAVVDDRFHCATMRNRGNITRLVQYNTNVRTRAQTRCVGKRRRRRAVNGHRFVGLDQKRCEALYRSDSGREK